MMTEIQKQRIHYMRLEGKSYGEIGNILNVSESTVKSFCRRNNLTGYGKEKVKVEGNQIIHTVCQQCGKSLGKSTHMKTRRFCCIECRRAWWSANEDKLNRKAYYIAVCAQCGKAFDSYGNNHRKYCSHHCYILARFGDKWAAEHEAQKEKMQCKKVSTL